MHWALSNVAFWKGITSRSESIETKNRSEHENEKFNEKRGGGDKGGGH